jgi:hypothetical protein
MSALSAQMAVFEVQLLETHYSYSHFGSWWFTFEKYGKIFRISFDGRDYSLSLDTNIRLVDRVWMVTWKQLLVEYLERDFQPETTLKMVISFIEKAETVKTE